MIRVEIFTDGACSGNPGAGGWGVLLRHRDTEKELSGAEAETTNNRMELTAVIEALKALKKSATLRFIPTAATLWTALPNGFQTGKRTTGEPATKNPRSKTLISGRNSTRWPVDTKSAGFGSRDITDIRKTNVSTSWRVTQYHL